MNMENNNIHAVSMDELSDLLIANGYRLVRTDDYHKRPREDSDESPDLPFGPGTDNDNRKDRIRRIQAASLMLGPQEAGRVTDTQAGFSMRKKEDRERRREDQQILEAKVGRPELVARLKEWRREKAAAEGNVPQYIVLGNVALLNIVGDCPSTMDELLNVRGIGPAKAEKYGAEILAIVAEMVEEVAE